MITPDINVLVYAHRPESPYHDKAADRLSRLAESPSPFALSSFVASGFIRIVTNHRIFIEPTSVIEAVAFIDSLRELPQCRTIEPGSGHWDIFKELTRGSRTTGNLVSDAYLAAIVIEHGCELLTADSDFSRFQGLKVAKLI